VNTPALYTKIPVTVEAMQWTRETTMRELKDFTNNLIELDDVEEKFHVYDRLHNTWITFQYGDWIIKGIKGEFYPVAEEVFPMTYMDQDQVQEMPEEPTPDDARAGKTEINIEPHKCKPVIVGQIYGPASGDVVNLVYRAVGRRW
jgi:hypothetical protein